ncbi:MAG TPA: class I SAM-dependent methyltransferase [Pyrinomonadaceae bacterium]
MKSEMAERLAFKVVEDMGGAFTMALGYLGKHLGLYKALAGAGPITSAQLAERTGLNERYVREWAKAMVAAEYIDYEPETKRFLMTEEQAFVLTDEDSPLFVGGALQFSTPTIYNVPKIMEAFKTGGGIPYTDIGDEIPEAIEQFFRPSYLNFLTQDWVEKVPGLSSKLNEGTTVADIGCGCGQSTVILAKAYPKSEILGVDNDPSSIERAKELSDRAGTENAHFLCTTAEAVAVGGQKFDAVCTFDCVHDMVDPLSVLNAIRSMMTDDGVYLWGEPNASDNPLENRNPVGKCFSSVSPLHCLTVSLAHDGAGLGTAIGENGARRLANDAGFSSFQRISTEHPFVQLFELHK